ncbi:MAG: 2-polyprenyl-3-methyl-5-hydroxy-6-metoxy-1,4-benzoquinol methylase [Bacteroidia bacterium]|jgi:2-polyprenyl-3-methyl-5-hydroxy-6-metoxy-1,4-benzoquinol methylase
MQQYRKILYQNYYGTHSGKANSAEQKAHFKQQSRYFVREFGHLLPSNKSASVLDIGCGTGSLLVGLKGIGYTHLRGIDLSPEQVKMGHGFGADMIEEASAEDVLKEGRKYDVIFAVDLIEHLSKDELVDFLALIKTALNPNGRVIFRTPNMDAPLTSVFAFADFTHEVFLNKSSAKQIMLSTGYSEVEILEGVMFIENPLKEILRKIAWTFVKLACKLSLYATARTWHEVVFTPNLVIVAKP